VISAGIYRVGSVGGGGFLLVDRGASLYLDARIRSALGGLTVNSGAIFATAAVSISESFKWMGGSIRGSGSLLLLRTSSSAIDPGPARAVTLGLTRFQNSGVLVWSSGAWRGGPDTLVRNDGTLIANSESSVGIRATTPRARFLLENDGLLERTAGRGKTWIGVPFSNAKMVKVHGGDLVLDDGSIPGQIASGDFCADQSAHGIDFHHGHFRLGSDIQTSGQIWVESPVAANDIQGTRATAPNCYR
jgi:hypothetical protein